VNIPGVGFDNRNNCLEKSECRGENGNKQDYRRCKQHSFLRKTFLQASDQIPGEPFWPHEHHDGYGIPAQSQNQWNKQRNGIPQQVGQMVWQIVEIRDAKGGKPIDDNQPDQQALVAQNFTQIRDTPSAGAASSFVPKEGIFVRLLGYQARGAMRLRRTSLCSQSSHRAVHPRQQEPSCVFLNP
jgi:hypothetical protein